MDPGRETTIARRSLTLGPSHAEGHYGRELEGAAAGVESPPLLAATRQAPVRTLATRTIAKRVNLLQPIVVSALDRGVVVTYAEQGRQGRTVTLDAMTLARKATEPYTYGDDRPRDPPYLATAGAQVALGEERLQIWNDDTTGRVFVECQGARRAIVSPPDAIVVGSPMVASDDGHHAVVVFLACDGETFSLVAVAIEAA